MLRRIDGGARLAVATLLQIGVDHVVDCVQSFGRDGLMVRPRVVEARLEGARIGCDGFVPQAQSDENVGRHVLRVRRGGSDLRIAAGRVEAQRREARRVVGVNDVMREAGVLRETLEQRVEDCGGAFLPRESGIGLRCSGD